MLDTTAGLLTLPFGLNNFGIIIWKWTSYNLRAYVLHVVIYTGKITYSYTGNVVEQPLKTVQIVNRLVEPFRNNCRTVLYVD